MKLITLVVLFLLNKSIYAQTTVTEPPPTSSAKPSANPSARVPTSTVEIPIPPLRKILPEPTDPSLILEPSTNEKKPESSLPNPNRLNAPSLATSIMSPELPVGENRKPSSEINCLNLPQGDLPVAPEISVILMEKNFFPPRIRLREGLMTRLFFTTTNDTPAAIVVEQMQIQRWVAKLDEPKSKQNPNTDPQITREVASNRVTEIVLEPRRGNYVFVDVVSGAKGQIIVE